FIYEKGSLKSATIAALYEENFRLIEVDFRPTAENFAEYFYNRLSELGYTVSSVTVYETPNNSATFMD
ncbi:MAG: 6-carboxytetrahydropterin synthase, partial [Oscillospiraceae bacterium]|nr:6-carboxytetrahydropterin synthase [Oscillospiraceae bacterium]